MFQTDNTRWTDARRAELYSSSAKGVPAVDVPDLGTGVDLVDEKAAAVRDELPNGPSNELVTARRGRLDGEGPGGKNGLDELDDFNCIFVDQQELQTAQTGCWESRNTTAHDIETRAV